MNLIVGLYTEPVEARRAEIRQCLLANLDNPFFGRVVVIEEDDRALASFDAFEHLERSKLRLIKLHQRITFADAFFVARIAMDPTPWVLANNDIEFDESIAHAGNIPRGELWCVTRTELDGSLQKNPQWSQDAWIWHGDTVLDADPGAPQLGPGNARLDWCLGVPGCENRLAHAAALAGLKVRNPARYIRALHRHASNVRRPLPRIEADGLSVPLEGAEGSFTGCSRSDTTR